MITQPIKTVSVFSAYYPSHGGGMELTTLDLVSALLSFGVNVEWAAQADGEHLQELDGKCTPLPGTDIIYALTGVPMPLPMPWVVTEILRIVKRSAVVVIIEANFVLSIAAYMAARINHKSILLVQHVGKPSTLSHLARLVMVIGERIAVRPMIRGADAVVYVSPVVADYFFGERPGDDGVIIGHGIDMAQFYFNGTPEEQIKDRVALGLANYSNLACFVGRLTESKGIAVVREMARLRPEWTFVVAGKGPVDPARWDLPNVIILGQTKRDDVARLYRASDVTVLPSQSESFSLVVREAMASGSRVLCSRQILETDAGLAPYIVTETVELTDVVGTSARFAAALDRQPSASRQEARDYVACRYSRETVKKLYGKIIAKLISPK